MTSAPVPLAEQPTPEAEKAAIALRIEMLEAETSNVLPGTEDGEELIARRHRWLIARALDRFAEPWRSKLAEQCGKHLATLQQHERAMAALRAIRLRAQGDGLRTFDKAIFDLMWIDDECRAALGGAENAAGDAVTTEEER